MKKRDVWGKTSTDHIIRLLEDIKVYLKILIAIASMILGTIIGRFVI